MISNISTTEKAMSDKVESQVRWNALDLLIILAKRRRFILTVTLGIAVITAIITLLLPKRYTAATSILPPQQSANGAALLSQLAGVGGGGFSALAGSAFSMRSQIDVYVAMFRSRTVEDAMIRRFNLMKTYRVKRMSDARKVFENRSTAVAGLKDGVIRITVDGPTPDEAAAMATAYVEEFRKLAAHVATSEAGQRRMFFDRQLEEAKDNLSNAEQDLKKTELTTGLIQPDSQSRAMIESAAAIQGEITAKTVQMQAISSFATEDNPQMVVLKNQLSALRAQLSRLTGSTGNESDLFVPKGKVPEAALDYIRKYREVKYREVVFQAIASQDQLARLDEAKQGTEFQIIDPATPPDKRSFPQRTILVILFTLLAFIFACFAALIQAKLEVLRADPEDGPKLSALQAAWRKHRS